MTKVYKVEFEAATNLIICTAVYFLSDIAEVVGSNPTMSIFIKFEDYCPVISKLKPCGAELYIIVLVMCKCIIEV